MLALLSSLYLSQSFEIARIFTTSKFPAERESDYTTKISPDCCSTTYIYVGIFVLTPNPPPLPTNILVMTVVCITVIVGIVALSCSLGMNVRMNVCVCLCKFSYFVSQLPWRWLAACVRRAPLLVILFFWGGIWWNSLQMPVLPDVKIFSWLEFHTIASCSVPICWKKRNKLKQSTSCWREGSEIEYKIGTAASFR